MRGLYGTLLALAVAAASCRPALGVQAAAQAEEAGGPRVSQAFLAKARQLRARLHELAQRTAAEHRQEVGKLRKSMLQTSTSKGHSGPSQRGRAHQGHRRNGGRSERQPVKGLALWGVGAGRGGGSQRRAGGQRTQQRGHGRRQAASVNMPMSQLLELRHYVRQQVRDDGFAVDAAVYRSVRHPTHSIDVTGIVNALIQNHGLCDFTMGRDFNHVFGDPAPREWKVLRIMKGGKELKVREGEAYGQHKSMYDLSSLAMPGAKKGLLCQAAGDDDLM